MCLSSNRRLEPRKLGSLALINANVRKCVVWVSPLLRSCIKLILMAQNTVMGEPLLVLSFAITWVMLSLLVVILCLLSFLLFKLKLLVSGRLLMLLVFATYNMFL